ncbi:beta-ketoacyl synthase N-terminal-like domain-containing protein [Streptomyces sp. MS1.HAVA.3]|uniref:Beta-ketoacyl synthase N-terminal-like domain-containing protein n=1 Tax=Streptomyces caledonius TaxID=3134107 RepID=A0ABU8U5M4_9ACTN
MTYEADLPLPEQSVAIIGMSGRFPGAGDVDALWRMVAAGEEGRTDYSDEQLAGRACPSGCSPTRPT